jgi:hypothetical protein
MATSVFVVMLLVLAALVRVVNNSMFKNKE